MFLGMYKINLNLKKKNMIFKLNFRLDDVQKNIYVAKFLQQIDTKGPCYTGEFDLIKIYR